MEEGTVSVAVHQRQLTYSCKDMFFDLTAICKAANNKSSQQHKGIHHIWLDLVEVGRMVTCAR